MDQGTYKSYIAGFILSIVLTLAAYFAVVDGRMSAVTILTIILALAVVQLVVQMFFGQNIAGKKTISPAAWQAFLRTEVTPKFPDGFTVFDAYGQWRDTATSRIDRERSKVVEIATPDTPEIRTKIQDLAATYRRQFRQQSVGIVTTPGCAAF